MPTSEIYDAAIDFGPWTDGFFDTGDPEDTPKNAFRDVLGYHWRKILPETEKGRKQHTGPQIVSSKLAQNGIRWTDGAGTKKFIVHVDGGLWIGDEATGDTAATISTLINTIAIGGGTAAIASDTVTVVGAPKGQSTLLTGTDRFWFDVDGRAQAATIDAVNAEGEFMVPNYGGIETSGPYTIERKLGATVDFALFDGRVAVSDGALRWHWYGGTKEGATNYIFREHGMSPPATSPGGTLAAGGALSAGDYSYKMTVQDARGVESNGVELQRVTATVNQKMTFAGSEMAKAKAWVKTLNVYRSRVDGGNAWYSIHPNFSSLRIAGHGTDATTSEITMNASAVDLRINQHQFRELTFKASTNAYTILSNGTADITVAGDVSGEGTDDEIAIVGGLVYRFAETADIVDLTPDTELDYTNAAPTHNAQGETAASQVTEFRPNGRLAFVINTTQVYMSGRGRNAIRHFGVNNSGEGRQHPPEFEYFPNHHDINADDKVEIVRLWSMDGDLYAGREKDIWGLRMPSREVTGWRFEKRQDGGGVLSKYSVGVINGFSFFLGSRAGETDITMFDGFESFSVGRNRIAATLDSIVNFGEATSVIYRGQYWLSYSVTGTDGNSRTLRFYINRRIWDKQPWGCGVFLEPYETGGSFYLYCLAPNTTTPLSHLYEVLGSTDDLGSDIQRLAITGKYSASEAGPRTAFHLARVSMKG